MIDSKLVLRSFSKSIQFLQKFLNPIGNPSNASKDASISIISITQGIMLMSLTISRRKEQGLSKPLDYNY